jgi:hypothetical protein
MAEGQRMTVADVVAQTRDGRLEDFVREAVPLGLMRPRSRRRSCRDRSGRLPPCSYCQELARDARTAHSDPGQAKRSQHRPFAVSHASPESSCARRSRHRDDLGA